MAQGQIIVTVAELQSASQKVSELAKNYHDNYTKLFDTIKSMADLELWNGKDNISFAEQIEGFRNDFLIMENLMETYANFLKKAAEAYKGTQSSVTEDVTRKLTN